jgi:LacI family kdg operon repressor
LKRVNILDVAKHAGVSRSTVSQYLNGRYEYMGIETKEKIANSIEELQYQPNILARSLKNKSTKTIGVIVANILHEFSTQIIRAIEDSCQELDFHIIVCNADEDPEKEEKYINMLYAKQIDGLIIFPTGGNLNLYDKLHRNNFPIVFMDRIISEVKFPTVLLDNEKASEIAVKEFLARNYRRLGIITTSVIKNITPRIERINGFKKALEKNNLPLDQNYIRSVEIDNIQLEFEKMLNLTDPPQAILAGNDFVLIEILKFIRTNNLSIPTDIALIGIDDVSFTNLYNPPITTIKQPTFEMGELAAKILLNKINGDKNSLENKVYRLQPELIHRSSC